MRRKEGFPIPSKSIHQTGKKYEGLILQIKIRKPGFHLFKKLFLHRYINPFTIPLFLQTYHTL